MKNFLKENIFSILFYLLIFACGLAIPITILVCGFIYEEIVSCILLSFIFGLPILTLLGFVIWMFTQDYKRYIEENKEE